MDKKKFDDYLTLTISSGNIRFHTIMNVLLLTNLLGFLPLLGVPRISFFIYLGMIPILVVNIWALLYIIAPYRFEFSFVLFYGVWGLFTSFLYFLVAQKFLYSTLNFDSLLFFYLGLIFYLISAAGVIVVQHLSVYGKIKIPEGPGGAWPIWAAIAPALGYALSQFIFSAIKSDDIKALIFAGCMFIASILFLLTVKLIHQYWFLTKHKQELLIKYPNLNKPKKERKFDGKKSKKRKRKSNKARKSI